MKLCVRPITLKQANELVARWHRHHKPVVGHRFSIGLWGEDDWHGAAIVGRPVAPKTDWTRIAEVVRLVTDGSKNGCSMLYAASARAACAMGYDSIQTFILDTEPGTSLKASGWLFDGLASGPKAGKKGWTSRPNRETLQGSVSTKQRWVKAF